MFKKVPVWNFDTSANSDVWFNPAQIITGLQVTESGQSFVIVRTAIEDYYFKGTPAQLNALLV